METSPAKKPRLAIATSSASMSSATTAAPAPMPVVDVVPIADMVREGFVTLKPLTVKGRVQFRSGVDEAGIHGVMNSGRHCKAKAV